MIIFYEKETGKIIGTIEGRVHFPHHLKAWIGDQNTVERIIIGHIEDENGERTEHNMHLWEHQLAWENPLNPRHPLKDSVKMVNEKPMIEIDKKNSRM